MPSQDNFNEFFQILEQKAYTDEDIQYLIQELIQLSGNKKGAIEQLGKYIINIAQAENIHIGDKHILELDQETLNKLIEKLIEALKKSQFKPPVGIPENIPRSGAVKFVGRDEVLVELHQKLKQNQTIAITAAITGMGGVGKTELALQYAGSHWNQGTYPGGICWLGARQADVGNQIVSFGRTYLDLKPPEDFDLLSQVKYCWRNWREGQVLVVLDDVVDYEGIKAYLPPAEPRFSLLLTSRQKLGASIQQLNLNVLSIAAALELLRSLVEDDQRVDGELEDAKALCEWLGYLPLGLELVGRFLRFEEDWSLAEMLHELQEISLEADALVERGGDMTAERGVAAAFELSWQRLEQKARLLGCCLSLFAVAPISWSLVQDVRKEKNTRDLKKVRGVLVKFNLLKRVGQETYQLHSLIKEFFRGKLEELVVVDDYKSSFCQVMVGKARKIPERPIRKDIEAVSSSIPHLKEAATTFTHWITDEDLILPFVGLDSFYQGQGYYEQARPWLEKCVSITRDRLGEEHRYVAASLNNLAGLYHSQGRYPEAEPLFLEALQMSKRLLGKKHPDVATSLNNLAALYRYQGRYQEAEDFYLEALDMRKSLLGEEHPDVAASINNIAVLYESQGRYQEAKDFYLEALEMRKSLLGEEHPDVAESLNNLAALYQSQGRYSEAEPFYRKALQMSKHLLGEEHLNIADILNNLAGLYQSQGKYQEAELLYRKALQMRKRLLGKEHPSVAASLNNLAWLYQSQGKYSEAEPLYLEALDMKKRLLGEEHPSVATSLHNLAGLYYSQERYSEAEHFYLEALNMRKSLLGQKHPDVAHSLNNLALLYKSQGKYLEAEPFYLEALQMYKRLLGEEHPSVAKSLNNLAALYYSQERYQEAEPLLLEALQMYKCLLGEEHPDIAENLNHLAMLYSSQGRYSEAITFFEQALDIAQRTLGENHPNTVIFRNNLKVLNLILFVPEAFDRLRVCLLHFVSKFVRKFIRKRK